MHIFDPQLNTTNKRRSFLFRSKLGIFKPFYSILEPTVYKRSEDVFFTRTPLSLSLSTPTTSLSPLMPPRATYDRPATQGHVGANFDAHDRAPSQQAGFGRPHDNNYALDRGHGSGSNLDNSQIDPSLLQVSPLGERQGQRRINVDSDTAHMSSGQRKCATCDAITATITKSSKRRREL